MAEYHNDVFISYSHIDNQPFGKEGGWVDIFHAALQNFVSAEETQRQSQELESHKANHSALLEEWEEVSETLQASE